VANAFKVGIFDEPPNDAASMSSAFSQTSLTIARRKASIDALQLATEAANVAKKKYGEHD